jgi:chaperonin GroES
MATKTSVKVAPLADRVVVKALEETESMRGGLYIPDTAKEKPQQGEIMAVGPGRYEKDKRVPMDVKVGDKVLYGKYSGTEVTLDGEQYLILRESDVLAVINESQPALRSESDEGSSRSSTKSNRFSRTTFFNKDSLKWLLKNSISTSKRARLSSAASISSRRR